VTTWKHKCDDCGAMANLSFPDGPAYCDADARKRGHADLLDLSWWQRIRKNSPEFFHASGMDKFYGD
jgi:hypothetical protein